MLRNFMVKVFSSVEYFRAFTMLKIVTMNLTREVWYGQFHRFEWGMLFFLGADSV